MILSVTKKFDFCYAHHLPNYDGKCKNHHGHNAVLEVEVGKEVATTDNEFNIVEDAYKGMIMDFGDLKHLVVSSVISELDHRDLNEVLPQYFLPPTAENICRYVYIRLNSRYSRLKGKIIRVRVYETPDSYAEIKG